MSCARKGLASRPVRPRSVPSTGGATSSRASSTTPTATESHSSPRTRPSWRTASSRAPASTVSSRTKATETRSSSLVIHGNLCYANGENGIYLKTVDDFVAQGNPWFDNGTSSTEKDGIRLEGAWDGIVLGNRCYDKQAIKTQAHGLGIVAGA